MYMCMHIHVLYACMHVIIICAGCTCIYMCIYCRCGCTVRRSPDTLGSRGWSSFQTTSSPMKHQRIKLGVRLTYTCIYCAYMHIQVHTCTYGTCIYIHIHIFSMYTPYTCTYTCTAACVYNILLYSSYT